ncbi:MAG: DUF2195 family protein [Oleispira sp.]|nr:DUF2195 family protein [Oleispira sp.]MBL4881129.1 DUF2195 family protein [Oleispira sp.]
MSKIKYSVLLFLVISIYAQAVSKTEVTINNALSDCIQIDETKVIYSGDIPLLEISHQNIKKTSECGCKSAVSEYTSELVMDGYNSKLLTAKFSFEGSPFQIPLAASQKMIGNYGVLVSFNCSAPD